MQLQIRTCFGALLIEKYFCICVGEISLYRLSWKKIWSCYHHGEKRNELQVTSLIWKPDGKAVIVSYTNGMCFYLKQLLSFSWAYLLLITSHHIYLFLKKGWGKGCSFKCPLSSLKFFDIIKKQLYVNFIKKMGPFNIMIRFINHILPTLRKIC